MTNSSLTSLGIQLLTTSSLQSQQSVLEQLSQELATGKQSTDLTDYTPTQANQLMNFNNAVNQRQGYLAAMNTVSSNLDIMSQSLTGLQNVVQQAINTVNAAPTLVQAQSTGAAQQVTGMMSQFSYYLNQQAGDRFIFSGSRYGTQPAIDDISTLPSPPTEPTSFSAVASPNLPSYDSENVTTVVSGQNVTIGGTVGTSTATQAATVTVNGIPYTYNVQPNDTTATIAAGLATLITAGGVASTSSGSVLTVGGTGTINSTSSSATDSSAYSAATVAVDTSLTLQYGVSSDDPAFQQLSLGLRWAQAAMAAPDETTYETDMTNARNMLTGAQTAVQGLQSNVAASQATVTQTQTLQNQFISDLTNQVDNIQQVDINSIGIKLSLLQTQLQASYSATAKLTQLSILAYLPT